jgi:sterol 3beta-glucosyltransferase
MQSARVLAQRVDAIPAEGSPGGGSRTGRRRPGELCGRGAPPVYVGFGSSVGPDPARLGAAVRNAVRQVGVRAVIASGWEG